MKETQVRYKTSMFYYDLMEAIKKALPRKTELNPRFQFPPKSLEEMKAVGDDYKVMEKGQVLASIKVRSPTIVSPEYLIVEYQGRRDILMRIRKKIPMDQLSLLHE